MDNVGEYNIYNIYDTCGSGNMSYDGTSRAGTPEKALFSEHIARLDTLSGLFGGGGGGGAPPAATHQHRTDNNDADDVTLGTTGGPPYAWRCGMGDATSAWMNNPAVRTGDSGVASHLVS
eukprot:SAG22_NODE_3248_length_1833_cov_1.974625_3_plen_120_part_00